MRSRLLLFCSGLLGLAGILAWRLLPLTPLPDLDGPTPAPLIRAHHASEVDRLLASLDTLAAALERRDGTASRRAFLASRLAYKEAEALLTALTPLVSGWLNGPPAEDEDDVPRPPGVTGGYQVVEAALFPSWKPTEADSARALVEGMRGHLARYRALILQVPLFEEQVLDAARIEIARISTLGMAGFDTDQSSANILEAAAALDGVRHLVSGLSQRDTTLERLLVEGAGYLRAHPDPAQFNRLAFYVAYANPTARAIRTARATRPAPGPRRQRLWRPESPTVFDPDAFDLAAYNSFDTPAPSAALVALGERLFSDPRLSGPGNRSCSTCHLPNRAFTDGRPRSPLINAGLSQRNTPTLINAALQPVLFYDQRAGSLEAQVDSVLAHPHEMASSGALAAGRLRGDSAMRTAFRLALGSRPEAALTPGSVRLALAAYLRTLTAMNARFDQAVRGDTLALSATEREGFTVYMGKGRCGTCHFLPFFNGTAPPGFLSSEGEIIGVPSAAVTHGARLDPDSGRGGFDRMPIHLFAFKVPTLRNIALTAPYMHNGAYRTLEQVVDFYNRGGGAGIGAEVPGQTLPDRKLDLTVREQRALIAFLGALTDTVVAPARAVGTNGVVATPGH